MSTVKGLVLAAGRGTRLAPLTDNLSKALVPLANRPLIEYALDKLIEVGIEDIGIVAGSNEAELQAALASYPANLSFARQDQPLGLAHAVNSARSFCGGGDFVLLFCDNLFADSLAPSLEEWQALRSSPQTSDVAALIHTFRMADPRACGVALIEEGWVSELEEKPQLPKSNLAVVGIDFFTPQIFDAIARIQPSARGEYEITDAIAELIRMGYRVRGRELSGFWYDTGTFRDLIAAHGPVLQAFADTSAPGSLLQNCTLRGAVLIGRDCSIVDCRLGPDVSIADGCSLRNCELQNVQVHCGSVLSDLNDANCIYAGGLRLAG
jgi:glucose-1-phosphate thymidylyltransferase